MRVLMISSNWPPVAPGGAEAYVADLTQALRSRGHPVAAVTLGIDGEDVVASAPARPHRLDVHAGQPAWSKLVFHGLDVWRPATGEAIRRAVQRFRPDVVHSHVVTGLSIAALTTPSRLGVAHVHTLHDYWLQCWRSTGTTRAQQPCGPACDAIARLRATALRRHGPHVLIAISQALLRRHADYDIGRREVRVLHHPTTPPERVRPRRGVDGIPTFGFLGQLNPNKGISTFLEAAARLAPDEARFVVAGRGRLEAEVAGSTLASLDYRGWVSGDAKEDFFADIDCLVVPSLWDEPAGLVVGEATVRGVPVIAADVGGLPEYVPTTCLALLCPPGDVTSLAVRMRTFAASPAAFAVDVGAVDTWDRHTDDVVAAYEAAHVHAGGHATVHR